MPLAPVSSNTCFFNAHAQSCVECTCSQSHSSGMCSDCVFHSNPFAPSQSTMSPHSHLPHHSPHHTMGHHTTTCVCAVMFVCMSLPACSFLTQPKPCHAIQSPNPPHMGPQMHERMSEWERAVAFVWTPQPKYQPPQPSHDATHTTCSLSFHSLAIHTLHNSHIM